jgi:hypothetical protein
MSEKKLGKTKYSSQMHPYIEKQYNTLPFVTDYSNFGTGGINFGDNMRLYRDCLRDIRWFYRYDPIASTVVTRIADMSITQLKNRKINALSKTKVDETTKLFFDAIAKQLKPIIRQAALEYLLHGMAIIDYQYERVKGKDISDGLTNKRYQVPAKMWIRNPDTIKLRKRAYGTDRQVFLEIPEADKVLIALEGQTGDGLKDVEMYKFLIKNAPEYVAAIRDGESYFELKDVKPIFRKLTSYDTYPTPYLTAALGPLQHKTYLKQMDKSIASRAIEALRHISVGNDDFPASDEDIEDVRKVLNSNTSTGERVFNLFTNHTVEIKWIFPDITVLINETKYVEPNSDIFMALGFPRVLTTGETLRSNSSDSNIAFQGPRAVLDDIRESILTWIEQLYAELAEINGFNSYPTPYFAPIVTADYTALIQFAVDALDAGAISRDDIAQLYGTDFDTTMDQRQTEEKNPIIKKLVEQKEKPNVNRQNNVSEEPENEKRTRVSEPKQPTTTKRNNSSHD